MISCLGGYILAQQVLHHTHVSVGSCDVELWREVSLFFTISNPVVSVHHPSVMQVKGMQARLKWAHEMEQNGYSLVWLPDGP